MAEMNQRNSYHKLLQKHLELIEDDSKTPVSYAQAITIRKRANETFAKYEAAQNKLICAAKDSDACDVQVEEGLKVEATYSDLSSQLYNIITKWEAKGYGAKPASVSIKLPQMDLPTFSGALEDWRSFSDLFQAAVGNQGGLTDAQKLTYLKTSVNGDAAKLIKSFATTDDNYDIAWKTLEERFDNQREIVHSLINRLLDAKPVKYESATELQTLLDSFSEGLNSLEVLSVPVKHWDSFLVVLMTRKLDSATRREWAISLKGTDLPDYSELETFLKAHVRGLQSTETTRGTFAERKADRPKKVHSTTQGSRTCIVCKNSHPLYHCLEFKKKSQSEKNKIAAMHNLCFNCLDNGHNWKSCTWKASCKVCGERHNTLLHRDKPDGRVKPKVTAEKADEESTEPVQGTSRDSTTKMSSHVSKHGGTVFMTAIVNVRDRYGKLQQCRVFVDSGSEVELVNEETARRLGLTRHHSNVRITGVGKGASTKSRGFLQSTLISRLDESKQLAVQLYILPSLTDLLPSVECQQGNWKHLENLQLGDPHWYRPGKVDMMIGIKTFHRVMLSERMECSDENAPAAWNSIFGWLVFGACPVKQSSTRRVCHVHVDPVLEVVKRFWEIEELPSHRELSKEEQECEDHFVKTHRRDENGKYVVSIPFNEKRSKLGFSRAIAVQRFNQVERRMKRDAVFKQKYVDFMEEYFSMGHMRKLASKEIPEVPGETCYLPHHGVLNEASSTTKLRVVFDGSASTTTGFSLNDAMKVGPTIQPELYEQLLYARQDEILVKTDIAKMYRMFQLTSEHANMHRIVWRSSPTESLQDFALQTVTYGTASASHCAIRCLHQLSLDCEKDYPKAAEVLRNRAYVDDLQFGEKTARSATATIEELKAACATAGLELRKWASNSPEVLDTIPEEYREAGPLSFEGEDSAVKTLGVQWCPLSDTFKFKMYDFKYGENLTKRQLLSDAAKVFDPLGLISCVTVRAKMLMQELWKLKCGWDEPVPEYVQQQWKEYRDDLKRLPEVAFPRRIFITGAQYEFHGFSDSSESGYGAAIYLRNILPDGEIVVNLVTSKSKVTPLKQVSLPRLELEAAVMLAKLQSKVLKCLNLEIPVILWTDSMITLKWIEGEPRKWSTFIGNRVAKIQKLSDVSVWRWVPGPMNPADLVSRGVSAEAIIESSFWSRGPDFLGSAVVPVFEEPGNIVGDLEERGMSSHHVAAAPEFELIETSSSLLRLQRTTALIMRFYHNCRQPKKDRLSGPIRASEINRAMNKIILVVQQQNFGSEMKLLKEGKEIPRKSSLISLHPFLDKDGLLRVTGRVSKGENIPEGRKHQIIIPAKTNLGTLIIRAEHLKLKHGGFQILWASLQSNFWMMNGRDKARRFVRTCVRCIRYRKVNAEQLMGNLPISRVTPARAFLSTGVDYAGPFTLKNPVGRVPKTYKGYLCIFVCMCTKAVHLELASSLCTEGFLQALRRFVSRRGLCAQLFSDNGTNFVGAEKELGMLFQTEQHQQQVAAETSSLGIEWTFQPPSAPHHGGLWEAAVKSAKYHIRRVCGGNLMTFESFSTVLCQIEAVLNSRPLYAASADPGDLDALTPGHFLIGEPLVAIPAPDLVDVPTNRLTQWKLQQQRVQHFWKRWSAEYLHTLQQRTKWRWENKNVAVGDLVLIVEESSPGCWKMGRIMEVVCGDDGLVRVAIVKTAGGMLKRSIAKLVPLVTNDDN